MRGLRVFTAIAHHYAQSLIKTELFWLVMLPKHAVLVSGCREDVHYYQYAPVFLIRRITLEEMSKDEDDEEEEEIVLEDMKHLSLRNQRRKTLLSMKELARRLQQLTSHFFVFLAWIWRVFLFITACMS